MKRKLIISIVLVLSIVLNSTIIAFAGDMASECVINEYYALKTLKSIEPDKLAEMGFKTQQIKEIESIDFKKMMAEIKKMPDDELLDRGIRKSDICIIRESSDEEEVLSRSLGLVNYRIDLNGSNSSCFFYSSGNTYLITKTTWNWTRVPTFTFMDSIVSYTNQDFTRSSVLGEIYYCKVGSSTPTKTKSIPSTNHYSDGAGTVSYTHIDMQTSYPSSTNPNIEERYYAKEGKIVNTWVIYDQNVRHVNIACNYGHSIINISSIGLSFSPSGSGMLGISFTPAASVETGDEYCVSKSR